MAVVPSNLSPHSFRVSVATELLKQSVSLETRIEESSSDAFASGGMKIREMNE